MATGKPSRVWKLATGSLLLSGCLRYAGTPHLSDSLDHVHYQRLARQVEYPDGPTPANVDLLSLESPRSVLSADPTEYLELTLDDTMQLALANSPVLRDLGGLVLRAPEGVRTENDPAIVESDPRVGVEAALSAFDASFSTTASFERNDRALNNVFFGGGTRLLEQDFHVYESQLAKRSATGSQFALKNYTAYDNNNAPGNQFASAWTTWFDLEARHPLLQGGGTNFNRIAGPNAVPGQYGGVVLARLKTDVGLTEFEVGVRNFVSDVENAYWDLYFAYRDLDAKIRARDAALETWRRIQALYAEGRRGGEAEKEAQAREQYYRFEEDVQTALQGRLIDGTRTNNGSSGGTFRGTGGVLVTERRLRLLIGLPISDNRMIRPADEPVPVQYALDWEVTLTEALTRRVELRRQKWMIKQRELEYEAAKNFLLPQLDAVARYRFRGFGKDLMPDGREGRFNNAYGDLFSGDFQEWQLGMEFSMPIGFRKAYAGVRNAELMLTRERAMLAEQERSVVHDLSNAVAEVDRAYQSLEIGLNRRIAAAEQVQASQAAYDADNAPLDLVLEAQRRLAEADTAYYRALVEYQLSLKNLQFEKGTLLDYCGVQLAEGPSPAKAYIDAWNREQIRRPPGPHDPPGRAPIPVSQGVYEQSSPVGPPLPVTPELSLEVPNEPTSESGPSDTTGQPSNATGQPAELP